MAADPAQKPWMFTADYAWRRPEELLSPYGIWIAEVMLQQTQLAVVLPYWQRWMQSFPTLEALAAADEQAVLLRWQGLGYYSPSPSPAHNSAVAARTNRW